MLFSQSLLFFSPFFNFAVTQQGVYISKASESRCRVLSEVLKIIPAQHSPDHLKDPDIRVWARVPGWKNSISIIIATRGPIFPNICSLFQSPYLFGCKPFKWNLIWICSAFLRIDLRCKNLLFSLAKMPVTLRKKVLDAFTRDGPVTQKPNHKSLLIQGASCKRECPCILFLWRSDLWPHTWHCCQTGNIWR